MPFPELTLGDHGGEGLVFVVGVGGADLGNGPNADLAHLGTLSGSLVAHGTGLGGACGLCGS